MPCIDIMGNSRNILPGLANSSATEVPSSSDLLFSVLETKSYQMIQLHLEGEVTKQEVIATRLKLVP